MAYRSTRCARVHAVCSVSCAIPAAKRAHVSRAGNAVLEPVTERSVAPVGTLLRIDGVENATRDATGRGGRAAAGRRGRAAWVRPWAAELRRDPSGDAYFDAGARLRVLVGEFERDDEQPTDTTPDNAASALAFLARSLKGDEKRVVEEAATLATAETSWRALELWQRYCATRLASADADARADRDEVLIDAMVRLGGAISVPATRRCPDDRRRILERRRAAGAPADGTG